MAGGAGGGVHKLGVDWCLLDGDDVATDYAAISVLAMPIVKENIRHVGEVANLMVEAGLVVLTAFISPHRAERQMVRERVGEGRFIEVFVDTPLAICEARRSKGL
ncbi:adenylyl-sulfate kinase [Escherichia coli]